nr:MAG TPA: hypothetical protein [Herelleviridae sp.]
MSQIKKLTSFMKLSTGEGDRIAFTYSTIDTESGKVLSQNEKGNFLIFDEGLSENIKAIEDYINKNQLN